MKKTLIFIAILAVTTACGTARFYQALEPISFNPEDVATGINEGTEVTTGFDSIWEEHNKLSPSNKWEPAWGWKIYDLDQDGLFEHILYQYKRIKNRFVLRKLDIKTGKGKWQRGDSKFIDKVKDHLDEPEDHPDDTEDEIDYDGAAIYSIPQRCTQLSGDFVN